MSNCHTGRSRVSPSSPSIDCSHPASQSDTRLPWVTNVETRVARLGDTPELTRLRRVRAVTRPTMARDLPRPPPPMSPAFPTLLCHQK